VRRLIGHLQQLAAGIIEHIEVRGGVPRRIVVRGSLTTTWSPRAQSTPLDQPVSEAPRSQSRTESAYER
jgi:hypothetical protein